MLGNKSLGAFWGDFSGGFEGRGIKGQGLVLISDWVSPNFNLQNLPLGISKVLLVAEVGLISLNSPSLLLSNSSFNAFSQKPGFTDFFGSDVAPWFGPDWPEFC